MDVKQAIATAKQHLSDVFADEMMSPPQLEEVWFDDSEQHWCITLGFWRKPTAPMVGSFANRDYKVVRLSEANGKPVSIRNRELSAA